MKKAKLERKLAFTEQKLMDAILLGAALAESLAAHTGRMPVEEIRAHAAGAKDVRVPDGIIAPGVSVVDPKADAPWPKNAVDADHPCTFMRDEDPTRVCGRIVPHTHKVRP